MSVSKKPRVYFHQMQMYDLEHGESYVRTIEMMVDEICNDVGWSMQFWRDCQTYGIREAYVYLKKQFPQKVGSLTGLEICICGIEQLMTPAKKSILDEIESSMG